MKTTAQTHSETQAAAIVDYYISNGLGSREFDIPMVRISQSSLTAYLELAFVAGERAEFNRLDAAAALKRAG